MSKALLFCPFGASRGIMPRGWTGYSGEWIPVWSSSRYFPRKEP
jgi:hypothetical protein